MVPEMVKQVEAKLAAATEPVQKVVYAGALDGIKAILPLFERSVAKDDGLYAAGAIDGVGIVVSCFRTLALLAEPGTATPAVPPMVTAILAYEETRLAEASPETRSHTQGTVDGLRAALPVFERAASKGTERVAYAAGAVDGMASAIVGFRAVALMVDQQARAEGRK